MVCLNSPVYRVRPVPIEQIRANAYNPNSVAAPEMALLELSILEDGYTQPIVCYYVPDEQVYEIVDGFHRYTVMLCNDEIRRREGGHLPVVVIDKDLSDRMASTIRHNRARGIHRVEAMGGIVRDLAHWTDAELGTRLGMGPEEILRLRQTVGAAAMLAPTEYEQAWETADGDDDPARSAAPRRPDRAPTARRSRRLQP